MSTVLMVIHIFIVAALILVVLMQKSEGGTLGASSNSMGGFMTARGAANLLTRLTSILTALFFISTIGLALYFKGRNQSQTILKDDASHSVNMKPAKPLEIPQPTAPLNTNS